ncbi:hypothetical protein [Enterococcus sp. UD-01]|uniref:hypothetical protein n=1 Tax=Enterococcus sp. UD-01 TaxID=3373911 RepID=UPI0038351777
MEEKVVKDGSLQLVQNKQPIKMITKQEIYDLKIHLEQLASWKEPLKLLDEFFENQAIPLNKKKIIYEFHAQARVFSIFYINFLLSMDILEEKISKLEKQGKLKT